MIDFRYHIVSLVAVFLALGVGIVLGSGPLDEQIQGALQTQTDDLRSQQRELRAQVTDLQRQVAVGEQFAQENLDPLTANQLTDRSVVIFTLPGADNDLVDAATKLLEGAGATVNGTVGITDVYLDPTKAKAPLEDLALRLVPPGVEFPDGATPIERVGTVVARATVASNRPGHPGGGPASCGGAGRPAGARRGRGHRRAGPALRPGRGRRTRTCRGAGAPPTWRRRPTMRCSAWSQRSMPAAGVSS